MTKTRQFGTVATVHPNPGKYGGSYGVILSDAGRDFVWCGSYVYRDRSFMEVGARVSFEAEPDQRSGYVTGISTINVPPK